jgi:hypothetical protein
VAFADRIEPLADIVARIEQEMRGALASLTRFDSSPRPVVARTVASMHS